MGAKRLMSGACRPTGTRLSGASGRSPPHQRAHRMTITHSIDDVLVIDTGTSPTEKPSRHDPIGAIGLVAGLIVAGLTSAQPTGLRAFDLIEVVAAMAAVVWFGSRARTLPRAIASGLAFAVSATLVAQLLALLSLVGVAWTLRHRRHRTAIDAVVVALIGPALATQGEGLLGPGSSTAIAVAVGALLIGSGWTRTSRRKRRRYRHAIRWATIAVVAFSTVAAAAALSVRGPLLDGLAAAESAVDHTRAGELDAAVDAFEDASDAWRTAERRLSGPWMLPSRAVPVVGQHVRATQIAASQAAAMADASAEVFDRAGARPIIADGQVDPIAVGRVEPALDALAQTASASAERLGQARSMWLLPPVGDRLDQASSMLDPAADLLQASADAVGIAAAVLATEQADVVVAFSTPAESRAGGGFVGSWAHLRVVRGDVELVDVLRSKQLNDALEATNAQLPEIADYERRYGRFDVERHIQDVALHPDGPTSGAVAASLFEQATGIAPDMLVVVDPRVFDVLLSFTGPIEAAGLRVGATNASDVLLRTQYSAFAEDDPAREVLLATLLAEGVDRLLAEPPPPTALASELAPLARRGHLRVWMPSEADAATLAALGIDGAFGAPPAGEDVIALTHQNAGQNKIDAWLRRDLDIASSVRVVDGRPHLTHEIAVTLHNDATLDGSLPDAVIGSNDQGLPPGSNRMTLSVYSTLELRDARVDGETAAVDADREAGLAVYSLHVVVPAGESVRVELELDHELASLDQAVPVELRVRPSAQPDQVRWAVGDAVVFDDRQLDDVRVVVEAP